MDAQSALGAGFGANSHCLKPARTSLACCPRQDPGQVFVHLTLCTPPCLCSNLESTSPSDHRLPLRVQFDHMLVFCRLYCSKMEQRKTETSREPGRQTSLKESFGICSASSKEVQASRPPKNLSSGRVYPCNMVNQMLCGWYGTCGRLEPGFRQVTQC